MPDDSSRRPAAFTGAAIAPALAATPFPFVLHYLRTGFMRHAAAMAALIALATAIETAQPYALGRLVNALAVPLLQSDQAVTWFAALLATWLLGYLLNHAYAAYASSSIMVLRTRIHDDLFGYLHGHAPGYFLEHASGNLAQKIRQGAAAAGTLIDYVCVNVVRLGVMFAVTIVMIRHQAPQLLPMFAVFLAAFTTCAALMAQRMRRYAKASAKASAENVARMVDSISNWEVVRSFAAAAFERETFIPFNEAERNALIRLRLVALGMRVVLHVLSVVFLGWLAWQAFAATRAGALDVGTFTTIVSLSMLVAAHIRTLGDNLFVYFEHYGVLSEALTAILAPHEIVDAPGAVPLKLAGGGVAIEDLGFAYPGCAPIFDRFSMTIAPGERVGLVGPSGAGKSTLIKLLRRQFTFDAGRILIDGQDITGVTWNSLHDCVAEVPQNPSIFHRSVRDNIRYSRPGASDEEVIAAAKLAHCHDFIVASAKGYDSMVGERGMKLSGGERQRIAIARAFLKNAPILLLDEATSSLDSEAEHLIQAALLQLMEGRTVIAIAHRLSTIMHLDRIVVLDRGRIVEEGTHRALLAANGLYARLWNRQAGGFI